MNSLRKIIYSLFATFSIVIISGCNKNNSYYEDTGLSQAKYNGTVMQYLTNNQYHLFDSLVKVIHLAGMDSVFKNDSITFFAPADTTIMSSVMDLNQVLYNQGKETITDLAQISPAVWKQELSMYLFKGMHRLKDYPQIDPNALQAYEGGFYESYGGKIMDIGVIFNDAVSTNQVTGATNIIKYAGYRQLTLTYFEGDVPPASFAYTIPVASSDINPTNGIVHVLQFYTTSYMGGYNNGILRFGFNSSDFMQVVLGAGIDYSK